MLLICMQFFVFFVAGCRRSCSLRWLLVIRPTYASSQMGMLLFTFVVLFDISANNFTSNMHVFMLLVLFSVSFFRFYKLKATICDFRRTAKRELICGDLLFEHRLA